MNIAQELILKIKENLTITNFTAWLSCFEDYDHIIGNGRDGDDCPLHHFCESLINNIEYRVVIGYFGYYITKCDESYSLAHEVLPEWAQVFNSYAVRIDVMDVNDCLDIIEKLTKEAK